MTSYHIISYQDGATISAKRHPLAGFVQLSQCEYHDALTVKRNEVCLLLHESLGGGFSM